MDTKFTYDPEFENLAKYGFESDYVQIKNHHVMPCLTAQQAINQGFFPMGTKVRFLNKNGYDGERARANEMLGEIEILTVKRCHIGSSSSTYEFNEVGGRWNTVMFEKI